MAPPLSVLEVLRHFVTLNFIEQTFPSQLYKERLSKRSSCAVKLRAAPQKQRVASETDQASIHNTVKTKQSCSTRDSPLLNTALPNQC